MMMKQLITRLRFTRLCPFEGAEGNARLSSASHVGCHFLPSL